MEIKSEKCDDFEFIWILWRCWHVEDLQSLTIKVICPHKLNKSKDMIEETCERHLQ